MIILKILGFIFGLGIIICIHELGHFIFAKRHNVLCYEFSIGMGPKIWSKKKGETTYSLRAIPIGGFVSMAGEEGTGIELIDDAVIGINLVDGLISEIILDEKMEAQFRGKIISKDLYGEKGNDLYIELEIDGMIKRYGVKEDAKFVLEIGKEMQIAPYSRCLDSKSLWARFITIFAGPLMNFVLAIVLYLIICFATGVPNYDETKVGVASYNATTAEVISIDGIESSGTTISLEGSTIKKINGLDASKWDDLGIDETSGSSTIYITVEKDSHTYETIIKPYIVFANLGVWANTAKSDPNGKTGVYAYMYFTNAQEGFNLSDDDIKNDVGVTIYKINDTEITSYASLVDYCISQDGSDATVYYYNASGQSCTTTYKLFDDKTIKGLGYEKIDTIIGISPTMKFSFFKSIGNAFVEFGTDATTIFSTLKLLFTSKDVGVSNLSGPIGIFGIVGSAVESGFLSFLSIIALLCVNVGIVNLLPIPALDGGRIIFIAYEAITRKKPNKKIENGLNTAMFILLMVLFVYIAFNDILRLF